MTSLSAGLVLGKVWIIVSIQLWLINFRKLVRGLELLQKIAVQLLVILIVLSFHQWKLLSSEKHKAKERHRCTWVQLLSPTLPWGKKREKHYSVPTVEWSYSLCTAKEQRDCLQQEDTDQIRRFSSNKNSDAGNWLKNESL